MAIKRVLIVEDDFMLNLMNKKYVEMIGHKVVAAVNNGTDAINAAKEHKPDVILMDIRLEGEMDGIDAMLEIEKFSSAKVIYLTGNSGEVDKNRASKTNMIGFCVKPIHLEKLQGLFNGA